MANPNGTRTFTSASIGPAPQPELALMTGRAWTDLVPGGPINIKYGFSDSRADYPAALPAAGYNYNEPATGFQPATAAQQQGIRMVYDMMDDAANLQFDFVPNATSTTATLLTAQSTAYPAAAGAIGVDSRDAGGDMFINYARTPSDYGSYTSPGSLNFLLEMHEGMHQLGDGHLFDAGGGFPAQEQRFDSVSYSVLSYRSQTKIDADLQALRLTSPNAPQTLMMHDLEALREVYGLNPTHLAGNTVHSWNPTTGAYTATEAGVIKETVDAPGTRAIYMTPVDAGGSDVFDFRVFTNAVDVDLRPGGWTTVTGYSADVNQYKSGTQKSDGGQIATQLDLDGDSRLWIEHAYGGSGNDRLTGNAAANILIGNAGDDVLNGGAGLDRLTGGAGSDTFYVQARSEALDFGAGDTLVFV